MLNACSPKRSAIPANAIPTLTLQQEKTLTYEFMNIPKASPKILLSLERYPCFGKCPVYKITFFEDGVVHYEGKRNVDLRGVHNTEISKTALYDLLQYAANINYSNLGNVYPQSGKIIMDVPLTITYVQYGAEINQIENHHNAPVNLIKFEEHIELLIDNLNWEIVN